MRLQVLLDPLAQRHRRRSAAGHESGQLVLKRPLRLSLAAEPAHLHSRRTAARDAIPIGPQRLPIRALRLQLEHLTLLSHLGTSSIDNEIEESHRRRDDDHLAQTAGVKSRTQGSAVRVRLCPYPRFTEQTSTTKVSGTNPDPCLLGSGRFLPLRPPRPLPGAPRCAAVLPLAWCLSRRRSRSASPRERRRLGSRRRSSCRCAGCGGRPSWGR